MRNNFIAIIIILFSSILVSLPLLRPGLHTIHDDQQVARLYLFDRSLKSEQIPPRWVDELGFGFGYPLFVFYPPLVYMVGETFHLLGFTFIDSVKLTFFLGIIGSGLAMYVFAKEFWGRLPATVASLFYILLPYRAIDVYVRGALAESFSFVWLPLILWSFYKLTKTRHKNYLVLSSVFLALLMISHNLIFLPFMLILPIYLLFLIWTSENKKLSIVNCCLSIVITLSLSAFFWIPAVFEKKYTLVDQLLLVNLANYKIHFVNPTQLWNWTWGFGGSAEGLADGISFKIGKLHILTAIAATILSVTWWIKYARSKFSTLNSQLSTLFFCLFIFSACMTTNYSKLIWDLVPQLGYLQFPWRFLTFTGLFTAILAGSFIFFLRLQILKLQMSILLIVLLFSTNLKLFKPQSYRQDLNDKVATAKEVINWEVSQSSFEYIPRGVETFVGYLGTNLVKIEKSEIPSNKLEIIEGEAVIENISQKPSKLEFNIDAKSDSQILVNTFNFPGWQVSIDGETMKISDNNRLKLITFEANEGVHRIKVEFKNTPVRAAANLISLFSILLIPILIKKWQIQKF